MFLKVLKINRPIFAKVIPVFSEVVLLNTTKISETLESPYVFIALYLLAFFSFLRLSNLVLHAKAHHGLPRHLARADIIFSNHDATVLIN